ncbi:MAG: hypothetical protein J1E63_07860 [Muribaculaceae bacterium]|nr:hypothetical protein [Muribaculaceae bacterium]
MTFTEKIFTRLKENPYFEGYKFCKSPTSFYKKTKGRKETIGISFYYPPFFQEYIESAVAQIYPYYDVRFDILHRWFYKFDFRSPLAKRLNSSISYIPDMFGLGLRNDFKYPLNEASFEEYFPKLQDEIITCSSMLFPRFQTLEQLYEFEVQTILDLVPPSLITGIWDWIYQRVDAVSRRIWHEQSCTWIFQSLALCLIVAPDNYPRWKEIILDQIERRHKKKEPNMEHYYYRLDEIFDCLEHYDFSKELAKMNKQ